MAEEEEIESSADELKQLQKLQELRKITVSVLMRWVPLLVIVFIITSGLAAAGIWWMAKNSKNKFDAQTNLAFYPKDDTDIKPLDCDQVLSIISRRIMFVKVAAELGLPQEAADSLSASFEVWQDKKKKNYFAIKASAQNEAEAVRRVNAFADTALREYAAYRLEDLRSRKETTDRRKAEIAAEIAKIDTEENALNEELGLASPLAESDRLTSDIATKKQRLSETVIALADAETRLKDLRAQLGTANPDILNEAVSVRKYTDRIAKMDEEIEKLTLLYTDENPKLARAREERESALNRYNEFLAKYGMKNITEGDLARLDSLGRKTDEAKSDLERLTTQKKALEGELKRNDERLSELLKVLPRYDNFKTRRAALTSGRRTVDKSDADIRFLEATVQSELSQIERCARGSGASTFNKKKLIAIGAAGAIAAGLVGFLFLMLEILRGKIHDVKELAFYSDAIALGEEGASREGDDEAFIEFQKTLGDGHKLFLVPMEGCDIEKNGFADRFLLQCSMAGVKALLVDIVRAKDYIPNDDDAMFTAISYRGDRGKLPVVDPAGLSSMEIAMLEADLAMLLSDFDLVVLKGPGVCCEGVLVDQLTNICDARLALVKPRSTLRATFRKFIAKEGVTTMSLAIRSLLLAAVLGIAGCYKDRLTGNYEQYPDLVDETSAIIDEGGMSEGERAEQYRILKALDDEPPETYRINAGDILRLVVYDHPDISSDVTITPDGHLGIVFLGQVYVANLTLTEACKKIEKGLDRYIKKPAVGLTPLQISSQSCTIAGGCGEPGIYTISSDMRLADLYAKAGGSGVRKIDGQDLDVADLVTSYIFRNGKALPIDFAKAIYGGDRLHNVRLRKNDYIYIGVRTESMVCVIGDIKMPRKQLYAHELGLIELLTNAGWLIETHWQYVIIIRGGVFDPKLYKVDVDAILSGKRPNVLLLPGDIVYVPHDNISEYNVFVRKLLPTGQLFNMLASPFTTWSNFNSTNSGR